MAVHARFSPQGGNSMDFKFMEGCGCLSFFHPANGFTETFHIYIHELIADENDFSAVDINMSNAGKKTGTLSFTDDAGERNYTFSNIDLISVQSFLTQQEKTRLITFKYRKEIVDKGNYCTINNTSKAKDPNKMPNKMGKTYSYRIRRAGYPPSFICFKIQQRIYYVNPPRSCQKPK